MSKRTLSDHRAASRVGMRRALALWGGDESRLDGSARHRMTRYALGTLGTLDGSPDTRTIAQARAARRRILGLLGASRPGSPVRGILTESLEYVTQALAELEQHARPVADHLRTLIARTREGIAAACDRAARHTPASRPRIPAAPATPRAPGIVAQRAA